MSKQIPTQVRLEGAENGMGTAAVVMGVMQFFCLGPIGSILAIIFGLIGMKKAKEGRDTNGWLAKWGFVLGCVGLALTMLVLVVFGLLVRGSS